MCATATIFILSHFLLGLIVGLGPPFVACALFLSTKRFFDTWVGKLVALTLVKVVALTVAVLTTQMQLVFLDMVRANPGDGGAQATFALLWMFVGNMIMRRMINFNI